MICFKIVLQNYELFFSKQVISVEKYIFLEKMYFESNIMKKILGLDLGTNSIGWALVNESENNDEKSSIVKLGVRVNPLTVDEQQNFEKGKSITTNADRTLKRSMRRSLQRYKLRREALIESLKEHGFISDDTILSENGNSTTFETYRLRAKAAVDEITLEQFARVLLQINKKRGYKSSRKAKGIEDGQLIDGMEVAKRLYEEHLTPGQLCLQLLNAGKKYFPDFYRSDLQAEFDHIWSKQASFYPEIFTETLKEALQGKNEKATWVICRDNFSWTETERVWNELEAKHENIVKEKRLVGIKREGNIQEQKLENFIWREKALSEKMHPEQIAVILSKINSQINNSSGYLGTISDRSKELYFNKQTVGQYQMVVLNNNPNAGLRNMVFYRQDYLDEFNTIWEEQAKYHPELTDELKTEIRDIVIFYQRRLKSQKGLISFCEFESKQIEVTVEGKTKTKTVGSRVAPRSSPLFQEFKIWQSLNNLEVSGKGKKTKKKKGALPNETVDQEDLLLVYGKRELYQEEKAILLHELSIKEKLTKTEILKLLFDNPQELELNLPSIQGNLTLATLFKAYQTIIEHSGHALDLKKPANEILADMKTIFTALGWNTAILQFNSDAENLDAEPMYKLWHLLYSFEGDNSNTGNENLIQKLMRDYGFDRDSAVILANITFQDDYGSLSTKAMRKILPYLKEGNKYDIACEYAGYRHSKSSLTKEEKENKVLVDKLKILPKNSLRNPVVEKIINQMVNVINTIIETYGKPDEIRVELARELKKNAKEREELTKSLADTTKVYDEYKKILTKPLSEGGQFGLTYVSRTDIIRYRLWKELEQNGYNTLYSNTYISPAAVFSGNFDIEHIIPQSRLFDDSFSNKTLELRSINSEKGNLTAYDFVKEKYGETSHENSLDKYLARVEDLYKKGIISRGKYNKLKMQTKDIPDGFINRDLGNTQYIASFARTMLETLCKNVIATTGSVTDALREDWQLIDVMKELNWDKYDKLGLTYYEENREGKKLGRIKGWTKRNDHRHHAMDALTVAFTKNAFVQYFNNKNASLTPTSNEYAIRAKYFENGKAIPPMPLNEFRAEAKRHLENTLVSIKSKNKVVTQNNNVTKKRGGVNKKVQLTPRGQLHLETVYGARRQYVVKEQIVNAKFDLEKVNTVCNKKYRDALLQRLQNNGNDPAKAFAGKNALSKTPIYYNVGFEKFEKLPEKVKTVTTETLFTIRKDVSSLTDLKQVEKVLDKKVKQILLSRIEEFNGEIKKAFSNLDENPIWLNKEKGISIKRVTITGISNAEALHEKRDKEGKLILDSEGNKIPVDFVNTGNNHHVAVYRMPVLDKMGNPVINEDGVPKYELQEKVVSFYEAVARSNNGFPIIDKTYKVSEGWEFLFSMKQNEYFVFPNEQTGFNPQHIDLFNPDNYSEISRNLFRVQKITHKNYVFRHHLETTVADSPSHLKRITWTDFRSSKGLDKIVKVRVNHIGEIVGVGEY